MVKHHKNPTIWENIFWFAFPIDASIIVRRKSKMPMFFVFFLKTFSIDWVVLSPSKSHHQEYYIFSRESQPKPSFLTVTGRGDNPKYR